MGESRAKFPIENLGECAPEAAPDAPLVRPVWWVSWSALIGLAHSALSASGEEQPVLPEACLEALNTRRASSVDRPVLAQISKLSVF